MASNLNDFDPAKDAVKYSELRDIDKWALGRLYEFAEACRAGYEAYEYHKIYQALHSRVFKTQVVAPQTDTI